jgi:hypothetical protein
MLRAALSTVRRRLAQWWAVEDPEERIEGSGEAHLDPAYNSRYTAERRLKQLSEAQDEAPADSQDPRQS